MKYSIRTTLATVLIGIVVPVSSAYAAVFTCPAQSIQVTTAQLTVAVDTGSMNDYSVGVMPAQTTTALISPSSLGSGTVAGSAKFGFTGLQPSTGYRTFATQNGIILNEIKGCGFTTRAETTLATTPNSTTTTTTPNSSSNPFRIAVTSATTTASIVVTSTLTMQTTGNIFVLKPGTDVTLTWCDPMPFPSGIAANPCPVDSLTPGTTYSIKITAKDQAGREYTGTGQFTTKGTGTAQGGATTNNTNTSGSQAGQTAGQGGGVFVATSNSNTSSGSSNGSSPSSFQLDVRLKNPLKVDTIKDAVKFFVDTLIKIAIPFIVIFFIWAGLKFVLAMGNPTKITEAKKMFWYTIIGTLLILGAWAITNAIIGTVNSIIS